MKKALILLSILGLTSCYQTGKEENLSSVSTTNNPNLLSVPNTCVKHEKIKDPIVPKSLQGDERWLQKRTP